MLTDAERGEGSSVCVSGVGVKEGVGVGLKAWGAPPGLAESCSATQSRWRGRVVHFVYVSGVGVNSVCTFQVHVSGVRTNMYMSFWCRGEGVGRTVGPGRVVLGDAERGERAQNYGLRLSVERERLSI